MPKVALHADLKKTPELAEIKPHNRWYPDGIPLGIPLRAFVPPREQREFRHRHLARLMRAFSNKDGRVRTP
jgi:hypothetical protein